MIYAFYFQLCLPVMPLYNTWYAIHIAQYSIYMYFNIIGKGYSFKALHRTLTSITPIEMWNFTIFTMQPYWVLFPVNNGFANMQYLSWYPDYFSLFALRESIKNVKAFPSFVTKIWKVYTLFNEWVC